ncbi:hypothetical protein [Ciceribacter sp. L1K22]|uniref:hypothetical protein n=1 Tax=Ciceribacter sp. L1K22 TaxID=2820275 RepID=UPI001ABE8D6B|nr:hypothetical protein [Ciceribacter sp. L1K22]MBO3759620.1 hypothetical protein [Ciceribacter sp. L1K22]
MRRMIMIGVFTAASCAGLSAGEGDENLLYGRSLGVDEIASACFSRNYDPAHLRAHPDQNVTNVKMLAYRPVWEHGVSVVNLEFRFRGVVEPVRLPGECRSAGRGAAALECGIECDGGRFAVMRGAQGSLLLDVPEGLSLCDSEEALDSVPSFGLDDKRFRLSPVAAPDCSELVFDDELRDVLTK